MGGRARDRSEEIRHDGGDRAELDAAPCRRGAGRSGPESAVTVRGEHALDVAGIGIGPANLSVAALLARWREVRARFYDRRPEFQWHAGLMFPDAVLQVSYLKDLVTLADPTSPYTFLAFLFATKRLYRFINAAFPRVRRREFNRYLQWVCSQLPSLEFGKGVDEVTFDGYFVLHLGGERARARNLILGTGAVPYLPECVVPHRCKSVFHASDFLLSGIEPKGQRIAVVGGGQTGAEVLMDLLGRSDRLPRELFWVSRRANFLPLDESPFANEWFTPAYSDFFYGLPAEVRARLLEEQKLASDGISPGLLESLYRRLYELEFIEASPCRLRLCPGRVLTAMHREAGGWLLEVDERYTGGHDSLRVDQVILSTGYTYGVPPFLAPLAGRIALDDDKYRIAGDFSIAWDGPPDRRIFVQNAARFRRGIADPNLSLLAWRSAKIVNSLLGRRVYDVEEESSLVDWGTYDSFPQRQEAWA
jgi:lysine N6-hydroxylase